MARLMHFFGDYLEMKIDSIPWGVQKPENGSSSNSLKASPASKT